MRILIDSPWNEKTVSMLKEWWEVEGLTAPKIIVKLQELGYSGVTRNAIIGKAHRLKLVQPAWKQGQQSEAARQRAIAANISRAKEVKANPALKQIIIRGKKYNPFRRKEVAVSSENPDGSKSTLIGGLKEGHCKYIIGYVQGKLELAMYCGEPATIRLDGKPSAWCRHHHSVCTQEARR